MVSSAKFRASTLSTPFAVQSHFAMSTENRMRLDDSLRNGSARDSLSAAKLSLAEPFLKESSRRILFSVDIAKCDCTANGVESVEARNFALDTISDSTLRYLAAPAEKTKPELFQALQL